MDYLGAIGMAALLVMVPVLAQGAPDPSVEIDVFVIDPEDDKSVDVYGAFTVEEDEWGGMQIVFYDEGYSYSVRSLEDIGDMATVLNEENIIQGTDNISLVLYIYLRPEIKNDGHISLNGMMKRLVNQKTSGEPLFTYYEEKLEFSLPDGGAERIPVGSEYLGRDVKLRLEAHLVDEESEGLTDDDGAVDRDSISVNTVYSLYNKTTSEYVIWDEKCTLHYSRKGDESKKRCGYMYLFRSSDDSTILYWSVYDIEDVTGDEFGVNTITFTITHIYATNPDSVRGMSFKSDSGAYMNLSESSGSEIVDFLYADKIYSSTFNKAIILRPGEITEIEFPPDKDSPLPFELKELITLESVEKMIECDIYPEMIHQAIPVYPEKAKKDKVKAVVWVKAYVDKTGEVKNAFAVKCSQPGYGFEESAIEAAYENRFKPALQGSKPVAIWITYSVHFTFGDN